MAQPATQQQQAEAPELKTEQEIVEAFNRMRQEQQALMSRIAEAESERHEYVLVSDTIKPLEDSRRCHRLVGGVLVERTVGEVKPMIQDSLANFDKLLKNLGDALSAKEASLEAFMTKYKIRSTTQQQQQPAQAAQPAEGANKGVLA